MNSLEQGKTPPVQERKRAGSFSSRGFALFLALATIFLESCGRPKDPPAQRTQVTREKPSPQPTFQLVSHPILTNTSPLETRLPLYELKMTSKDLAALDHSGFGKDTYPATFIANGVTYEKVRVRFRGQWARTWPKKPIKIFFNETQLFEGRHCLNLNSGWRDPAFIREPLAYFVYGACGAPAPKARMARLNVNGKFRGLYVEVEQPDKAVLKRLNLKGASLFKAQSDSNFADERDLGSASSFGQHYQKETQKSGGFGELQSFCHDLARATNVAEFFENRVALDNYINYLAATILVQNWDCLNKNHFLLYDGRGSCKWSVVPWDLDRTFGDHWHGGFESTEISVLLGTPSRPGPTGWNRMETRFLNDAKLRARLLDRLAELLETEFTSEKLFPLLDHFEAEIKDAAALDRARWPGSDPDLHRGIAQVKSYIDRRRTYLLGEVARMRTVDKK